jgi:hypothetical protein
MLYKTSEKVVKKLDMYSLNDIIGTVNGNKHF